MDWAEVGGEGSGEGGCRGEVEGWEVTEGRERERWMGEEGVGRRWREKHLLAQGRGIKSSRTPRPSLVWGARAAK